jgi:hypothetical protein
VKFPLEIWEFSPCYQALQQPSSWARIRFDTGNQISCFTPVLCIAKDRKCRNNAPGNKKILVNHQKSIHSFVT